MKAKHWIIVGVLAVLCVGAAVLLYNKTSEEGVPANAGVASSVPAATEEPTATVEPVEDAADEENKDTTVVEETKAEEKGDTTPDASDNMTMSEQERLDFEDSVEGYMSEGMSREEAEAEATRRFEQRKQHNAEIEKQKWEEFNQRQEAINKEVEARHKAFEKETGLTWEQWISMSNEESLEFMRNHPEMDFSMT